MADSTLADIDWTDLDSAEMTTAIKVLLIACQERHNIAFMDFAGDFFGPIPTPNVFPFADNDPIYTLFDGDPFVNPSGEVEALLSKSLIHYLDVDKLDDYVGTTDTDTGVNSVKLQTYNDAADAPGTYDNRLFEKTGYTSWPDLSVCAPEEVKKLYDMVTTLKVVIRPYVNVGPGTPINDNEFIFDGEFDPAQSTGFVVDETGADYYGGNTRGEGGNAVGTATPYTDFKTGNSNLFASGSTNWQTGDTGTEPDYNDPYKFNMGRLGGGNYWAWQRSARWTYSVDWTDIINNLGITGRPIDYDSSIDKIETLTEDYPTGHDTAITTPAAVNVIYHRDVTISTVSNVDELEVDDQLGNATLPTNITDIAAGEEIDVLISIAIDGRRRFYENWDGEGGFDSYTP